MIEMWRKKDVILAWATITLVALACALVTFAAEQQFKQNANEASEWLGAPYDSGQYSADPTPTIVWFREFK